MREITNCGTTLFERALFNVDALTSEQRELATLLDSRLQESCESQLVQQESVEQLAEICLPLVEALTDIILSSRQSSNLSDSQRSIDAALFEAVLEKLAPFLRPGLVERCVDYLALTLRA